MKLRMYITIIIKMYKHHRLMILILYFVKVVLTETLTLIAESMFEYKSNVTPVCKFHSNGFENTT